ncbi:hypothetical protein FLAG1_04085 [Fusarium langsethiae]|uniref:Glycosyltransferase family 2 protein n=1 Tax=Fusarium langsethiae TaxID=179993 RepID=A0A0M9EZE3_FUSLA|nr:hypothetical protein FLAG1_04085 [Fusarium langsethiae]GKU02507.1 unnamed protein product [Fusarium langsethiae]GKU15196.1 unnamed protein product [Fusarium langsethiae]
MLDTFLTKTGALALALVLISLSCFRWFGLLLHHHGRIAYRPTPFGKSPRDINVREIAVILPVVNHQSENLIPTVESILMNLPGQLYVMVVGREAYDKVEPEMGTLRQKYKSLNIHVGAGNKANKRRQIAHALGTINHRHSRLTVITEQGAYWSPLFLMSACYPFDDSEVAAVTVPRMAHIPFSGGVWASIKAHLFSFYYDVQAEDNRAVNSLDGSALFSRPTTLVRTHYLKEDRFKNEFEAETWVFERSGSLTGDEHFFLNRYLLGGNKKIFFQDSFEAVVWLEMNSRTCFSMAPTCAWLYVRHKHVIFPAAACMTWWPTIFSFALLIDILSIILAFNYSLLNKAALCVWITVSSLMVITQAVSSLLVAKRMYNNDFNVLVTFFCVLISLPFRYALEFLKIVALLTFWKTDAEGTSQAVEVIGKDNLPWSWDFCDEEQWIPGQFI